jgi:hypothetical protein
VHPRNANAGPELRPRRDTAMSGSPQRRAISRLLSVEMTRTMGQRRTN